MDLIKDILPKFDAASLEDLASGTFRKQLGVTEGDMNTFLRVARNQLNSGRVEQALTIYEMLVFLEPSNENYLLRLAHGASLAGRHDQEMNAASAAILANPENPLGYYFSGHGCFCLGHLTEAEEDLCDAIALAEKHADTETLGRATVLLNTIHNIQGAGATEH